MKFQNNFFYFKSLQTAANQNDYEVIYYLLSKRTEINENMFSHNQFLDKIAIPPSITEIDDNSFYEVSKLTLVSISSSVTKIGNNAFYKCSSLKKIVIPSSVETIGDYCFYFCPQLEQAICEIPSSLKSIGKFPFYIYSSLAHISIPPKFDKTKLKGCGPLKLQILNTTMEKTDVYFYSDIETSDVAKMALEICNLKTKLEVNRIKLIYKNILIKSGKISNCQITPNSVISIFIPKGYL